MCLVFPSTFAGLAPADETATTPISASAHRRKGEGVAGAMPAAGCRFDRSGHSVLNTARRAWFAALKTSPTVGRGCGVTA